MTAARRIDLNPCDILTWAQHRLLIARGQLGNIPFMFVDLDGAVDPARGRAALADLFRAHPVLMAGLRTRLSHLRPYWRLPDDPQASAGSAIDQAYVFHDWRDDPDWQAGFNAACAVGNIANRDLSRGPQVRMEHHALPDDRTRICIRWPHLLTDAEGAQWLLAEWGRCVSGEHAGPDAGLLADHSSLRVLKDIGLVRRARGALRAVRNYPAGAARAMCPLEVDAVSDHRMLHRHWDAHDFAEIRTHAKQQSPPGPALYARFLAACVIRAAHELATHTDGAELVITFPMRARIGRQAEHIAARPLPGNYLTAAEIRCPADEADDLRKIGDHVHAQVSAWLEGHNELDQWALMWAAGLIHNRVYLTCLRRSLSARHYSSGFSLYGEIAHPLRRAGDARVTNIWGGGPIVAPPGVNPVFSRFERRLNLTLTYARPAISDNLAHRYVDAIEAAMFGRTPVSASPAAR